MPILSNLVSRYIAGLGAARDVSVTEEYIKFGLGADGKDEEHVDVRWLAPELLLHDKSFTTKSDVWAFGVTLWEIFSFARNPYGQLNNREVQQQVEEACGPGLRGKPSELLNRPAECTADMYEIMRSCWRPAQQLRPTFTSLRGKIKMMAMPECEALVQKARQVATYAKANTAANQPKPPGSALAGDGAAAGSVLRRVELGCFGLSTLAGAVGAEGDDRYLDALSLSLLDDALFADRGAVQKAFDTLATVRHPSFIQPRFFAEDAGRWAMRYHKPSMFESLSGHLSKAAPGEGLPSEHRLSVLAAVANALDYLHSHDLVCTVLSPHTIIVDESLPVYAARLLLLPVFRGSTGPGSAALHAQSSIHRYVAPEV